MAGVMYNILSPEACESKSGDILIAWGTYFGRGSDCLSGPLIVTQLKKNAEERQDYYIYGTHRNPAIFEDSAGRLFLGWRVPFYTNMAIYEMAICNVNGPDGWEGLGYPPQYISQVPWWILGSWHTSILQDKLTEQVFLYARSRCELSEPKGGWNAIQHETMKFLPGGAVDILPTGEIVRINREDGDIKYYQMKEDKTEELLTYRGYVSKDLEGNEIIGHTWLNFASHTQNLKVDKAGNIIIVGYDSSAGGYRLEEKEGVITPEENTVQGSMISSQRPAMALSATGIIYLFTSTGMRLVEEKIGRFCTGLHFYRSKDGGISFEEFYPKVIDYLKNWID